MPDEKIILINGSVISFDGDGKEKLLSSFDMFGYRPIERLDMGTLICNDPGKPPELVMLRPSQLVINAEYQRELSASSKKAIQRMAHEFDWAAYKALSVAPTDNENVFEVVDGQHTAIAAITNGRVPFLPCLLHSTSVSLKEKAAGFIDINTKRIALTPMAIFNAKVAAQDESAIAVQIAMDRAGVTLLTMMKSHSQYEVGETMAVGSMLAVAKKSSDARLSTILRIAVLAKAAPVSAMLIKALDLCVPMKHDNSAHDKIVQALTRQGIPRLEIVANSETPPGRRSFETMADKISDAAGLQRRAGRPAPKKQGRPRVR